MLIAKQKISPALIFKTERLDLMRMDRDDAAFIFDLLNSAGWLKFIGDRKIRCLEDAAAYIDTLNHNNSIVYWKVVENITNNKLGIITLVKRDFLTHADIGFAFLPQFTGKGYAYEATNALVKFLFEHEIEDTIMAITNMDNVPSIKLLEKIGMQFLHETTEKEEPILVYQLNKIQVK